MAINFLMKEVALKSRKEI